MREDYIAGVMLRDAAHRHEYRGYAYYLTFAEGVAYYEIHIGRRILRGEGNHGFVKDVIDTCIANPSRTNA